MKVGRKTKLTPANQEIICDMLRAGATFRDCCKAVGISWDTMLHWREQGRNGVAQIYVDFLEATDKADVETALLASKAWIEHIKSSPKDWKSVQQFLLTRHSSSWSLPSSTTVKHEHSGPEGKPIAHAVMSFDHMSVEELLILQKSLKGTTQAIEGEVIETEVIEID